MDSSFVTFSPKRKLKKPVHSKITKLSLRHPKRGHDRKTSALRKNKSPPKCDRLQQMASRTRISNLSTLRCDKNCDDLDRNYLDTEKNIYLKQTEPGVAKTGFQNEEDGISSFDTCKRVNASQFSNRVEVGIKPRLSEDIVSPKIKTEVRTPPSIFKGSSVIVISESSSDESSSVTAGKPKKTSSPQRNVNIVINESDSEPGSFNECANSVNKSILTYKAANTLHYKASSDKQSEIEKWLQNISPKCKDRHHVNASKSVVSVAAESWRSKTRTVSSSESEDNFEEFIKSVKKKTQLSQQKLDTPDSMRNFITDGSVENSPGFYISLTNKLQTEEKKKIAAERTKKIRAVELKFNESDTDASDKETETLVAVQKEIESTNIDSSPDVETVSSETASGDSEDDSDIPPTRPERPYHKHFDITPIRPTTGNRTERPYLKQPQKVVPSCRKPKSIKEKINTSSQFPVFSFLASLSHNVPQQQCNSDAVLYKREFQKRKDDLCSRLFCLYNLEVFDKQLPSDMPITWNARLMKTAGLCYNKVNASKRTSRIELSIKVCDTADRLRDTLIHELCHSASWIIDGVKSGHGYHWKRWADRAMKCFPDIPPIRRCHDYKIRTKFVYKCVQCGYSIGRHSKSLDMERKRCGYCLGKFELFINKPTSRRDSKTPTQLQTPKTPSAFAVFVKENYGSVKKERSDLKHGEVMKLLGQKFAAIKVSTCVNTV